MRRRGITDSVEYFEEEKEKEEKEEEARVDGA